MNKNVIWFLVIMGLAGSVASFGGEVDYSGLEKLFAEPVTTSATGKPQRMSETPVSMEIITSEEIRRSGAVDIPQILRSIAGIDVARNFKGHADVNIRGYNQPLSNRMLVLINGRQVYMDNFGMTLWHSLPIQMAEIKQIEIVRGPNSSLFGFNAASGVVNIITFNPLFDDRNVVEGRVGSQEHLEGSAISSFKFSDDFGLRLSVGHLSFDGFSRDPTSPIADKNNTLTRVAFNLDAMYRINNRSSLRFEYGINKNDGDILVIYNIHSPMESITRNYRLEFNHDTDRHGVWTAHFYRNELDINFSSGPNSRNRLNHFQLHNLCNLHPDHTFRWGTEFRNNEIEGDLFGVNGGKFAMNVISGNGMWDWHINDHLSFTNSLRIDGWSTQHEGEIATNDNFIPISLDDYERNETEYSFNSGLLYQANPNASYRLSIAKGLHVPSLVELSRSSQFTAAEFYGNPKLDPESNLTIEIGIERKLSPNNMTIGGNLFYEEIDDVIQPTLRTLGIVGGTGGAEADFTFENVGNAEAYGIEFMANGKLVTDQFHWKLNYTYLINSDDPDGLPDHFIHFEDTQPKHQIDLILSYNVDKWEINTDIHYVSSTNYTTTVGDVTSARRVSTTDDYVILNARIGYFLFESTTISLDGFNLADKHQERPSFTVRNPGGMAAAGGNEIGRALLLTLRHYF